MIDVGRKQKNVWTAVSAVASTCGLVLTVLFLAYLVMFPVSNMTPTGQGVAKGVEASSDVLKLEQAVKELVNMLEFSRVAAVSFARLLLGYLFLMVAVFAVNLVCAKKSRQQASSGP